MNKCVCCRKWAESFAIHMHYTQTHTLRYFYREREREKKGDCFNLFVYSLKEKAVIYQKNNKKTKRRPDLCTVCHALFTFITRCLRFTLIFPDGLHILYGTYSKCCNSQSAEKKFNGFL